MSRHLERERVSPQDEVKYKERNKGTRLDTWHKMEEKSCNGAQVQVPVGSVFWGFHFWETSH